MVQSGTGKERSTFFISFENPRQILYNYTMKKINVFLASSSELAEERKQIALMISRLNDSWVEKGIYMKLVLWEELLHSFQGERVQDYFNEEMLKCDIMITLFFKKVGQFTEEEFRRAYQNLKQGKKPHWLFVYFKSGSVSIDDIDEEILKIKKLKNEIEGYQEIYRTFDSIPDLTLKLQHQLDLVVRRKEAEVAMQEEVVDERKPGKDRENGKLKRDRKSGSYNVLRNELESLSSFRNPWEDNVEYIKIPGGTYRFSVSKKMGKVPDLYFCKYPVTNKRYRKFISFLEGKEKELEKELPMDMFAEKLVEFSSSIKGYSEYLGKDSTKWPDKLRSRYDDDKEFNGNDQPLVAVTWYGARAYCFWLSCLEEDSNSLYRLPTEMEWEWAAGGEADDSVREYPWPKEKGKPNPNLANYGENVRATTPVGRYPQGATPLGLMDMAGNVWEWMGNYYDKDKDAFALRGGSWNDSGTDLRCSARGYGDPGSNWDSYGFRVVRGLRAQS